MKLKVLLLIGLVSLAQVVHGADTPTKGPTEKFLCVVEKSSGLSYNSALKDWQSTVFRADKKYIVSPAMSPFPDLFKPENAFEITELGDSIRTGWCKAGFTKDGFLFCDMFGGEFKFDRNSGRFLVSYTMGYFAVPPDSINTPAENDNTPYVAIGKCSSF